MVKSTFYKEKKRDHGHLGQRGEGDFVLVPDGRVVLQAVEDGVHEEGQARDPLHGQHQEGVHGEGLAHRRGLQHVEDLQEAWVVLSVVVREVSVRKE